MLNLLFDALKMVVANAQKWPGGHFNSPRAGGESPAFGGSFNPLAFLPFTGISLAPVLEIEIRLRASPEILNSNM